MKYFLQFTKTGLHTFATVVTKDTLYVNIMSVQHFILNVSIGSFWGVGKACEGSFPRVGYKCVLFWRNLLRAKYSCNTYKVCIFMCLGIICSKRVKPLDVKINPRCLH